MEAPRDAWDPDEPSALTESSACTRASAIIARAKKSITIDGIDLFDLTDMRHSYFLCGLGECLQVFKERFRILKSFFEVQKHNSKVLYNIFPKEDVFFKERITIM